MNVRVTAGLFVVLLVLLAVVFLQQQSGAEPTPAPTLAPAEELLPDVELDQIQRLEIHSPAGEAQLVLERDAEDSWLLVTPSGRSPITETITSQLNGLLALTSRNTLPSTANPPEAYGLDAPDHSIVVVAAADDANRRYVLNVGHETPTADGYYVMRDGDPRVFVVLKFPVDSVLGLVETLAPASDLPDVTPTEPPN